MVEHARGKEADECFKELLRCIQINKAINQAGEK
jgi:hypothetical protein